MTFAESVLRCPLVMSRNGDDRDLLAGHKLLDPGSRLYEPALAALGGVDANDPTDPLHQRSDSPDPPVLSDEVRFSLMVDDVLGSDAQG